MICNWLLTRLTARSKQPQGGGSEFRELTEDQRNLLKSLRQGDVFPDIHSIVVLGSDGPRSIATPKGVAIVSQTCDVVWPDKPLVQVARCVRLADTDANDARKGRRPRYAHLAGIADHDFADLNVVCSLEKDALLRQPRTQGVTTDDEVQRFGRAVARASSRFAFPDDVVAWLQPLTALMTKRSGKQSSEGQLVDQVIHLRLECSNGWREPPYDLTLLIVVDTDSLPFFPDDQLPDMSAELRDWLYGSDGKLKRPSNEIADRLGAETNPALRYWLWTAIGEAWAARCRPRSGSIEAIQNAVPNGVQSEVLSADDLTFTRIGTSEQLDLDHLSPLRPSDTTSNGT